MAESTKAAGSEGGKAYKQESYDYLMKILLLGDSGVGKSSLMHRFADDEFPQSLLGTTGIDFKVKVMDIDGYRVKVQIWDTAGQERYRSISESYYKGAVGIILVYDVTDKMTFESVDYWMERISKNSDDNEVEVLILGNKVDLVEDIKVKYEEAKALADGFRVILYETSAKDAINVDKVFKNTINNILHKPKLLQKCKVMTKDTSDKSSTSVKKVNKKACCCFK